jgi:holo-[acyl-carrier protein] synthase
VATLGVGLDLVDVARFASALARRPRLAARLFTDAERAESAARPERLAARFAAKEAVLKSLGVGIGAAPWREIEVRRAESGAPQLVLAGVAARLADERGVAAWHLSLSHTAQSAGAVVVAEGADRAG